MNRKGIRLLCAASVAGGALATTAIAADPENGTVNDATPKVTWKGEVTGSTVALFGMAGASDSGDPGRAPCEAPTCDTFTLQVAKQADLSIGADVAGDGILIGLRIKKPDGSSLFTLEEASKGKPVVVKFKKAAVGEYVVDYTSQTDEPTGYDAFAEIPAPAPATPPPSEPAPAPEPGGQQQPPPAAPAPAPAAQNIDLTIKPGKASARKLKKSRKLAATVTVSREVAKLTGFLRKGSKTIGKVSRGTTAGTVKVTLKLSKTAAKKLKKGAYTLTFVADDGKGTTASKTVKVKVTK